MREQEALIHHPRMVAAGLGKVPNQTYSVSPVSQSRNLFQSPFFLGSIPASPLHVVSVAMGPRVPSMDV